VWLKAKKTKRYQAVFRHFGGRVAVQRLQLCEGRAIEKQMFKRLMKLNY